MEYGYINIAAGTCLAGITVHKEIESGSAGIAYHAAGHHYISFASLELHREVGNSVSR